MTRVIAVLLVGIGCLAVFSQMDGHNAAKADAKQKKVLRHVVLFKFKKSATEEQVQKVVDAFAGLPEKIDAICEFEMGTDVSVENKAKGFTHCFLVTFRDEKGREAYLPHPAHQALVKLVVPIIEDVLVIDYWAKR
jgi:hypothetical protein